MAPNIHWSTKRRRHLGPASKVAKKATGLTHAQSRDPPPGPCPSCGIKGHWKVDCPNPPLGIRTSPPGPEQESSNPALPSLLGLAAVDGRCLGLQAPTLTTSMESRVTLTVTGKPVSLLIDTGAAYSAMPACSGKTSLSGLCCGS